MQGDIICQMCFFENLNIDKETLDQPHNNPENHKHKTPNLSSEMLQSWGDELFHILTRILTE